MKSTIFETTKHIAVGVLFTVVLFLSAFYIVGHDYFKMSDHALLASTTQVKLIVHPPSKFQTSDLVWTFNRDGYDPLTFFVSGSTDYLSYNFLIGYNGVIEPHAAMRLYVEDYKVGEDYYYYFEACSSSDTSSCYSGSLKTVDNKLDYGSITVSCNAFDVYDVTVSVMDSADEVDSLVNGQVMCMYVRREIRSLTEDDLTGTMDAMYKLWSTDEETGQHLYGDKFHNITYLIQMHHFNAAWRDADHFHEGNGFMVQHIKMTNIFEDAMRAVNPAVSVPYWDFTIEESEGLHAYDSKVMSDTMFGSLHAPSNATLGYTYDDNLIEDFAIKDGRWAYIKAEFNPTKFSSLQAGYGYMRSPWNMNPSPYVTRFTGTTFLPKCSTHYDMMSYTDMMSFMVEMETSPHASTHGDVGGAYGCDLFQPLLDAGYINDEDSMVKICKIWIFSLKSLYRKNMIKARDCDVPDDTQIASCPFQCMKTVDVDDWEESLESQLFDKLLKGYVPSDIDDIGKDAWVNFVCGGDGSRVIAGDHAESASPSDPSFWPIHPTLERLLHTKLMVGGFETTAWGVDSEEDSVCIRYECYENNEYGKWDECCYGHFENDQMLDFINGIKENYVGPTNGEIVAATDPTSSNYSMPYIYDDFSWGHCSDDFASLLEDLAEKYGLI